MAIPLITAAIDEDREILKELWAKLLANALDPNRSHLVRPSMIELLRQLDPLDARVLDHLAPHKRNAIPATDNELAAGLAQMLKMTRDETFVSLERLFDLGCLMQSPNNLPRPNISSKGPLLIRAVSDDPAPTQ